jgi:hypothetical protein
MSILHKGRIPPNGGAISNFVNRGAAQTPEKATDPAQWQDTTQKRSNEHTAPRQNTARRRSNAHTAQKQNTAHRRSKYQTVLQQNPAQTRETQQTLNSGGIPQKGGAMSHTAPRQNTAHRRSNKHTALWQNTARRRSNEHTAQGRRPHIDGESSRLESRRTQCICEATSTGLQKGCRQTSAKQKRTAKRQNTTQRQSNYQTAL